MSEPTRVRRTIDTGLSATELWELVADGDAWARWMVDESDVTVAPGADGTVVDDGVTRHVHIDHLDDDPDGARVGFTWWPDDRPDLTSSVELVVLPAPQGSRLLVTETFATAHAGATASPLAWDVRLMLLVARALAVYV